MSLRLKTIAAISLIMLFMSAVFFYATYYFSSKSIASLVKRNKETIESVVKHTIANNKKIYEARLKGFVTANQLILKAMSEKDAAHLNTYLNKRAKVFKSENTAFQSITIVAPDYKVITRTINNNRGDSARMIPFIREVMESKKLVSGINITKGGVRYTLASPAYYDDKFIGVVVFVLNTSIFDQHLKNLSNTKYGIYTKSTLINKLVFDPVESDGDYVLINSSDKDLMTRFSNIFNNIDDSSMISIDKHKYIYHKIPLCDYKNNPIAHLVAINDVTEDYDLFISTLAKAFIIISLLLAVGISIVYISLGKLMDKLKDETGQRQKNEQMLFQQSKFVDMGKMVSAIAHQWRQPLNALGILVQDMEDAKKCNELTDEYIENSVAQTMKLIQHMSDTIDDFRNFYTADEKQEVFCATGEVQNILSLFSARLVHNDIELNINVQGKTFNVNDLKEHEKFCNGNHYRTKGNLGEFKQVILNLVGNAIDVLVTSEHKKLIIDISAVNNEIVMIFTDTGGGIPADIMDRIFEPYFTTKQNSGGTGLGLYLCKLIIEQRLTGSISVENTDSGARFTVKLPMRELD